MTDDPKPSPDSSYVPWYTADLDLTNSTHVLAAATIEGHDHINEMINLQTAATSMFALIHAMGKCEGDPLHDRIKVDMGRLETYLDRAAQAVWN